MGPSVYERNRIVVRQIGSFPEGTIVPAGLYTLNTIYNIFLYNEKEYSLLFLLGILNSKAFRFIWLKRFYDNKATFPKIKKAPLEFLPLPKVGLNEQEKVIDIVSQILEVKQADSNSNTDDLETEINQLVFEFFGLTDNEIQVIEKETE